MIATTALLAVILVTVYLFASEAVSRSGTAISGRIYLYSIIVPFILFELWVHRRNHPASAEGRDIPVYRRYLGALIETSMPTVALALHINSMGAVAALGFVAPMTYFIFIILSTLRLDFWLSTFTGFVAAAELFAWRCSIIRRGGHAEPSLYYHAARSLILLICGMLAGAVGHAVAPPVRGQHQAATARDRITNLFGQHVSPQVVERLMAEGTAPAANPPRRRHVRRLPQLHRRRQHPHAAGGGGPARRRVRGAGRYPRPPRRFREQVFG